MPIRNLHNISTIPDTDNTVSFYLMWIPCYAVSGCNRNCRCSQGLLNPLRETGRRLLQEHNKHVSWLIFYILLSTIFLFYIPFNRSFIPFFIRFFLYFCMLFQCFVGLHRRISVQYEPTGCTVYFQFISIINLHIFRVGLLLINRRFVCLFSWRYNPLWLYFSHPVAGFSLLIFQISSLHTTTCHSR
jgi:hypothetical protein